MISAESMTHATAGTVNIPSMSVFGGHYSFCSQYLAIDLPQEILRRLLGKTDYDDIEDTLLYTRLIHEKTHYVQNLTTAYGIVKTIFLRSAGVCFLQGFTSLKRAGIAPAFPFSERLDRARRYSFDDPMVPFVLGHGMHGLIDAMEHQHSLPTAAAMRGVKPATATTNPFVSYDGSLKAITAGCLLEFQAFAQQELALDNMKGIPKSHADALVAKLRENINVRLTWNLVAAAFGIKEMSAELHFTAYELVTLALSPMWEVDPLPALSFFRAPGDQALVPWESVHAGWRFLKIVEHIRDAPVPLPPLDDIGSFVLDVARALQWPSPFESTSRMFDLVEEFHGADLSDFVAMKGPLLKSLSEQPRSLWWTASVLSSPYFNCRGPLPELGQPHGLSVLYDVASQLFYSARVFCPACISWEHKPDCGVQQFMADYILGGHDADRSG